MQDRYVGDIGDYVKLAILRALAPGHRLGVAWWRIPDESHNRDGRHISYLNQPDRWRRFDPDLFDGLSAIVATGRRDISALHTLFGSSETRFALDVIPSSPKPSDRPAMRKAWFAELAAALDQCDLIFLDPDNGLEPARFRLTRRVAAKSVGLDELGSLKRLGRVLILYHHQTRRPGGHLSELAFQADRLRAAGFRTVDALRARPYSPRLFFILDAPPFIRERAEILARRWGEWISWHPDHGEIVATTSNLPYTGLKAQPAP